MNNVNLTGRITTSLELKYTKENQKAYLRFLLAVEKSLSKEKRQEIESKGQPTADFINVVAWENIAETIFKYSSKGLKILVTGKLQTNSYENNAKKIFSTEVLASNVEFIDWKDNNITSTQKNKKNHKCP